MVFTLVGVGAARMRGRRVRRRAGVNCILAVKTEDWL